MTMPTTVPRKTALGREEQRARGGGLGQRHRTILFLVDGQRTAEEVLRLARQAGVSTEHFDELVRLGFIELPASGGAAARPAAAATIPASVAAGAAGSPPPARPSTPASAPPVLDEVAVPRVSRAPLVPVSRPPDAGRPVAIAPRTNDDLALLDEVRAHLLEALRVDPPPFVARLASRVRGAADAQALGDLVSQIERELGRQRRSPLGAHHIEQARDLLGLGNTMVAEDSSWHGWPDTL